ncbi:MAG: DUF4954 family protein [Bacteroidetes bacterium]|nr:DUF4954 family protein [Bacteroidota bacterium]
MNIIKRSSIGSLGFGFVDPKYLPKGKDEYYLRNRQLRKTHGYRTLTKQEIRVLEKNDNSADDWKNIKVMDPFEVGLIKRCSFFGLIRIGKLEPVYHEFNNLRLPAGLYHSTIISCDFGDNVVVDNVRFMSHYIIGNEAMLVNIHEIATTDHAKFGNGVVKVGESETVRIWMEVANENTGRAVLPFKGMESGDVWIWSKYRDDEVLMNKLRQFTDDLFDVRRGYYGKVGERSVIKNCHIIKDVWVGSDAYIKGANKLKNLTIDSSAHASVQIGEGTEMVNGIVGPGCRAFYGVKAVRFIMGAYSQLKYGARLINSYLGENSTISCCEVLNSLIYPGHEQHHNNSFLCASVLLGQSNLAAGATIGSNHNSRSADGELVAGRGFWPGLCVSLKHNSRFASYTLLAKGDYSAELDVDIPFALVSNDYSRDRLTLMPGYWFFHNLYALSRNVHKYKQRDQRTDTRRLIEYDFLAPDTVNEMLHALHRIEEAVGMAYRNAYPNKKKGLDPSTLGRELLSNDPKAVSQLSVILSGVENSPRAVRLLKSEQAYDLFQRLIVYHAVSQLIQRWNDKPAKGFLSFRDRFKKSSGGKWKNIGGQLMPEWAVQQLLRRIRQGTIGDWPAIHAYYDEQSRLYPRQKAEHALASALQMKGMKLSALSKSMLRTWVEEAVETRVWMMEMIRQSRAKDHQQVFRKMLYDTQEEMDKVVGKFSENAFIRAQEKEAEQFVHQARAFTKWLGSK